MKNIIVICLLFSYVRCYCQGHNTLLVYFPLDKTNFTEPSAKFLDSLVTHNGLKPGNPITLLGYGDYLGDNTYNKNLSYARAKNVEDYVLASGFHKNDITLIIGKGKINRTDIGGKAGSPIDRKVEMIINKIADTPAAEKFNYYMLRLDTNETMPLKNIQFYRGSLRMTPPSLPELQMLINFMLAHKTYYIRIEGHVCCLTDNQQDEPYDESTLSTLRAKSIYDSLLTHGVNSDRMRFIGLGKSNPIASPEVTEEDQRLNRRVEVRILSK